MAKEYEVRYNEGLATIVRVYNKPGLRWRDAKKMAINFYLSQAVNYKVLAKTLRSMKASSSLISNDVSE